MVTISMDDLKGLCQREKIYPSQIFDLEELLGDEKIKSYVEQKKAEYKKKEEEKKKGSADFIPDIPGDEGANSGGSEEGGEANFIPD